MWRREQTTALAGLACTLLIVFLSRCDKSLMGWLGIIAALLPSFAILFIAARFESVAAIGGALGLWAMALRLGGARCALPEPLAATILLQGMAYGLAGALVFLLGVRLIRRINRP